MGRTGRRRADRTGTDRDLALRIARSWRELRRGAAVARLRAHVVGPAGQTIEQAQFDALEILTSRPDGWRMTDFADAMRVEPSTATRAIDRLEAAGLAERTRSTDDKRVVTVQVTPAARQLVRDTHVRRVAVMQELLASFSHEERVEFAEFLERFVTSIDHLAESLRNAT